MAGGGSAYVRLQKPDDNISQSLQYWGGQNAELGKEFRDRNEKERLRLLDEQKQWEKDYGYNYDDFKAEVTGFDTYDQIQTDYTRQATDKYIDLYREADELRKSGKLKEAEDVKLKMLKLKGSFKQLTEANTHLAEINKNYTDMVNKGLVSGVDADNWEAQMESILKDKNFKLTLDENSSPVIIGIQKNTDGTEKPFSVKYSQIVDGSWRPYQKQNLLGDKGIVTNIVKNLGSYSERKQDGLFTIDSTLWNDRVKEGALSQINLLLGDDETMADLLNQATGSKKKSGFTDEDRKTVRDSLLKMVEGSYKETYKKEYDKEAVALQMSKDRIKSAEKIAGGRNATSIKVAEINAREKQADRDAERQMHKEDLEIKKKQAGVSLNVSDPYTVNMGKNREGTKQLFNHFQNYTLTDKNGKPTAFYVTGGKTPDGKNALREAGSVEINKNGKVMRVNFLDGQKKMYLSNTPEYKTVMNQIERANSGSEDTEYRSSRYGSNSNSSYESSSVPDTTAEDLRNIYGY